MAELPARPKIKRAPNCRQPWPAGAYSVHVLGNISAHRDDCPDVGSGHGRGVLETLRRLMRDGVEFRTGTLRDANMETRPTGCTIFGTGRFSAFFTVSDESDVRWIDRALKAMVEPVPERPELRSVAGEYRAIEP
uniref:RNA recognition motif domain containing protein n=1 Tax=Haemonchus contortus TaxID=6289 RepID=A0A7I4YBQ8_HAECO